MGAGASSKYQNPEYVAFMASWGSLEKLRPLVRAGCQRQQHGLLAELDKLIVDDIEKKGGARFAGMDNKPALLRTYYATCSGGYEDDYIEKHEFRAMLRNLFFFTKLWAIFQEVDSSENGSARATTRRGDRGPGADMFRDADVNDGGMLLFDEFCKFVADQLVPMSKHDAEYAAMEQPATELGGDEACESCLVVPVNKKRKGKHGSKNKRRDKRFGASKSKLKREAKRFAKCTADFAEMQLNKKSLARAWAARLQRQRHGQPRGDRQRDEFRAPRPPRRLRVWDLFYEFDSSGDRRLDLAEFARGCASLGIELSAKELIKEFDRIDENGGLILFKEFALRQDQDALQRRARGARGRRVRDGARGHGLVAALRVLREPRLGDRGKTADLANRLFNASSPGPLGSGGAARGEVLCCAPAGSALEVFDFEVYDDNCVHTGDVALWPPQPRLKTRLIYEGYDVKELSQSINLMSQTMHAMYTGAPLPAAGFLPLVTKEEDA
ncbi:hypothetical protein JL720_14952 [Aureococcus anophagefferens]|nr:hypothetical protein JL720_14952 [Aureococcus anophagefferens]